VSNIKQYKICITTGLAANACFFIENLSREGFHIDKVFVQTNSYRKNRESKRLKEKGIAYLPYYIENYIFINKLGLPLNLRTLLYGRIRHSKIVCYIMKRLRNNDSNTVGYLDIHKYEVDFYTRLRKLKSAVNSSIKFLYTKSINDPNVAAHLKESNTDMLLIMGGQIVKKHVLEAPILCTLTIHNSVLPYLRGWGGGELWALLHDNQDALGTTVFYTNEGMDTGDILLQKTLTLLKNDTLVSLKYRNIILGNEILIKSLRLILKGNAPRLSQDDGNATYIDRHPTENEMLNAKKILSRWIRQL